MNTLLSVKLFTAGWMTALVFTLPSTVHAAETPRKNPHLPGATCDLCHEAPAEDLASWFTFPSTKRRLKGGRNGLCQGCHQQDFGHGVGATPRQNKRDLPLDGGLIACAITCHDMHLPATEDRFQRRYFLRHKLDDLCRSCHDK